MDHGTFPPVDLDSLALRLRLLGLRLEVEKARSGSGGSGDQYNRWPAGTPGSKGGQFAPTASGSHGPSGGHGGWNGWLSSTSGFGHFGQPEDIGPPPGSVPHPKADDNGKTVHIHRPTKPSPPESWSDGTAVATFVPGGDSPKVLNGIAFKSWTPPSTIDGWNAVTGQNKEVDDSPITPPVGKKAGAGVLIVESDGRVWLTRPTNSFGGYVHTWPKGTIEHGMTPQASAIKEAYEETGLKIEITGTLGIFERDLSVARMYVARRVTGTPKDMGWESQAVRLVPAKMLTKLLNRQHDRKIANELVDLMRVAGVITKAKDAPLYVSRALLNVDEFVDWAKAQGFTTTLPPEDMHVTILYSKAPMNWAGAGIAPDYVQFTKVEGREVVPLGDEGAVVMKFPAVELSARHDELIEAGGSHDYDEFRPHVTITYNGDGVDLSKVTPFSGTLKFGPELFKPIDTSWKDDLVEKAGAAPSGKSGHWQHQDRWPGGSPLGGQWKAMGPDGITMPPKLAGGLEGKNPSYQKKLDAIYGAAKTDNLGLIKDVADQTKEAMASFVSGNIKNSHVKWKAGVNQYAHQVLADIAAGTSTATSAAVYDGPGKISAWTKIGGKPGGSNPGGLYVDGDGAKWLVKGNAKLASGQVNAALSEDRARNEILSAHLMNAVIPGHAPDMKLVDLGKEYGGGIGVASKWIDGAASFLSNQPVHVASVQKTFALHVWLGNYDVIGLNDDNVAFKDGKPINIDPGGALLFRAQGLKKDAFLNDAPEWESMRDKSINPSSSNVFGKMSADQLADSAKLLANITDEQIKTLVDAYGPKDTKERTKLEKTLIARRAAIFKKAGLDAVGNPLPNTTNAPVAPKSTAMKIEPAVVSDSAVDGIRIPKFKTGFAKSDKFYAASAAHLVDAYKKSDLAAIESMIAPDKTPTDARVKLSFFATELSIKLQEKLAAAAAKPVGITKIVDGDGKTFTDLTAAGVWKHSAAAAPKSPLPPPPNFQAAMLPLSNTNAAYHNAKIANLQALSEAKNEAAILALGFGVNTYGKQQSKLANAALAAMGSPYTVSVGQKPNSHPALNLNAQPTQAAPVIATTAPAAAEAKAKASPVHGAVPPHIAASKIFAPPNFSNWQGSGKGLSSKDAYNKANDAAVQYIHQIALTGNLDALKNATFQHVDPTTGTPTGKVVSMGDHPSKHVQQYFFDSVDALDSVLNPPKPLELGKKIAIRSITDVAQHFASTPYGTTIAKVDSASHIGFWIALGAVTNPAKIAPKVTADFSAADIAEGKNHYAKSSHLAKTFMQHMQGSGSFASAYRNGLKTYNGSDLKQLYNAAVKDAKSFKAGTTIYRWQNMTDAMLKHLDSAPVGAVYQATGPMPHSYDPTATKGFGKHKIIVRMAEGSKVMPSYGSGSFSGEKEITTLPYARFMILSKHWESTGSGKRMVIETMLLPHHE